ncbi:30S ribosomal protein S2 [Candidatus Woesearchaeota archaeon]|nr:30S ribosomal protein S2 [Candidatus Woesearchaeota archaeon]
MTEQQLLVAQDTYLKSGIHIGTKFRTKYMEQFIYKTRPDGLSVLNLQKIDERIRLAANLLSQFASKDVLIVSRRENGWKAVRAYGKHTGTKVFAGRYPPGILTNPQLDSYMETKIILVTDAWPDRNAVLDAQQIGLPVIALCDTNTESNMIDLVVPCNNKGKKSLGLLFYILAREYLRIRGQLAKDEEPKFTLEEFTEE